jgi:hypothetical protein
MPVQPGATRHDLLQHFHGRKTRQYTHIPKDKTPEISILTSRPTNKLYPPASGCKVLRRVLDCMASSAVTDNPKAENGPS